MQIEHVFVFGCGDVGTRLARLWRQRQVPVAALTRDPVRAERLREMGVTSYPGDLDAPAALADLPVAGAVVYYLAPPPARGLTDARLRGLLGALRERPRKWILISTTGVYGDCKGAWIDESRPVKPGSDRARRRLDAETALRADAERHAFDSVILRVAGIYGPGRLPEARLRSRSPMVAAQDSPYTNRIHVDDLVQVCAAAAERAPGGSLYNVSDGNPGRMTDYFTAVADTLSLPRPPVVSLAEARTLLGPELLSYLAESRRLDNRRLLDELQVRLRYPSLELALLDLRRELEKQSSRAW